MPKKKPKKKSEDKSKADKKAKQKRLKKQAQLDEQHRLERQNRCASIWKWVGHMAAFNASLVVLVAAVYWHESLAVHWGTLLALLSVPPTTLNQPPRLFCSDFFRAALEVEGVHPGDPAMLEALTAMKDILAGPITNETILARLQPCEERVDLTREVERVQMFLELLKSYWLTEPSDIGSHAKRTVVVGGGPAGLLAAIQAVSTGNPVITVEKRANYTRNQWIDVYGPPWYESTSVLKRMGLLTQTMELHDWNQVQQEVYDIRLQLLERFMAKVMVVLGGKVLYSTEFLKWCPGERDENMLLLGAGTNREALAACSCDKAPLLDSLWESTRANYTALQGCFKMHFDVLVGADGSKSKVRTEFHMGPYKQQNTFRLGYGEEVQEGYNPEIANGIHQLSLIAIFKPDPKTGLCPRPVIGTDGKPLDPWAVGFLVDGVDSTFKRFYFKHCQLQVLLWNSLGKPLWQGSGGGADWRVPWTLLRNVTNAVLDLDQPVATTAQLKKLLVLKEDGEPDAQVVLLRINKASKQMLMVNGGRSVVLLAGDALMSAHYRLGIGINSLFLATERMRLMYQGLTFAEGDNIALETHRYNVSMAAILAKLAQYQLSTMFYESFCGFIVFFENTEDVFSSQTIWYRDTEDWTYYPLANQTSMEELKGRCKHFQQAKRAAKAHPILRRNNRRRPAAR